jgi:hypothetical protein
MAMTSLCAAGRILPAASMATSRGFTYQSYLAAGGSAVSGNYDFQFRLYDALTGGNQVGSTLIKSTQTLTNGLFTGMPYNWSHIPEQHCMPGLPSSPIRR